MTQRFSQESNSTGLSIALETTLGTVDGSAIWITREPNTYGDFGGSLKLVARQPINASRQSRKGVTTDLDASGKWQEDLTYANTQTIIEGIMFAAFRTKHELKTSAVVNSTHAYTVASGGAAFVAGAMLFAKGFGKTANNGLKKVTSGASTSIVVTDTGVQDETIVGTISQVGFEAAAADITFATADQSYNSTTLDFTTLGIVPGEWIHVGDDAAGNQFATAAVNGYKRVRSIAVHKLVIDKTISTMGADDAGTGKTVRIFYGRYIKNESDPSLILRKTYQLERQLNKADTSDANQQAEYVVGSVLDNTVFTFNSADKITYEITTVSTQYETRDGSVGPKAGSRPALNSGSAFNTSVDIVHTGVHIAGQADPLYIYLTDCSLTIANNTKPNKALGVLGAFDLSAGEYEVSATANAYFADVAAQTAIIDNADVTMEIICARDNSGIIFDLPLVSLGDGRLKVASNEPITLPLSIDAASNSSLNAGSDYTLGIGYFDYLPEMAMGSGAPVA